MTQSAGTVLVIDDEQTVREVLARFLGKAGYAVLTATMGFSAEHLEVDATLQKPFDMRDVQAAIETALAARRAKP